MIIGTVSQQLLFLTGGEEEDDMIQAWVNFNGTGTVAIRESNNVSSITDNGTGDYTVNFTTSFEDSNYAITGCGNQISNDPGGSPIFAIKYGTTTSISSVDIIVNRPGGSTPLYVDPESAMLIFVR